MNDMQAWFEIAKYIGAGGAFVLGVVCWKLWNAYREEVIYSKTRDRETLTVLAAMVSGSKDMSSIYDHNSKQILSAIQDLKNTIMMHNKIHNPPARGLHAKDAEPEYGT